MIDLHMHTKYSDGSDSVEEILKKAENKKIEVISITDHDSVNAYYELDENPKLKELYSGKIITGIEMMSSYRGVSIEVLGYGIDYKNIKIPKIDIEEIQKNILENMKQVSKKLGLKYNEETYYIDINNSVKQYASVVMGTELLKYDENKQILRKIGNEFETTTFFRVHQSNKKSPFYVDLTDYITDINKAISIIHDAGGLAFLAHGYIYPFQNKDEVIEEILNTTEIDGIECIYTNFSENERKKACNLCKKYNKYMSGGTDYHGILKFDIELGSGRNNNMNIQKELIGDWISKLMFF